MALSCDLIVAADDVQLGVPEVKVGLLAGGGGLVRLPTRIGYGMAMEMSLTGNPITSQRALELGLVSRTTPKGEALEGALSLAARISQNAPLSVVASKRIVRSGAGLTEPERWEMQEPIIEEIFASHDAEEGPRSFLEKRPPNWSGS